MDLPKPVHGMSNVNLAILKRLNSLGLKPSVINTVPSYAARLFNTPLWIVFKIFHTFYCYLSMFLLSFYNIRGVVYRPINGGVGQFYDLIYIVFCRIFFNKIYIHHHSFNYLNDKSLLFGVLNRIAGEKTVHIVLGERMGNLLTQLYGIDSSRIKVVSNLSFFESRNSVSTRHAGDKLVLGHLANLCLEKGVGVFIDVCRSLQALNVEFSAKIAGPFANDIAREKVMQAIEELPRIKYVGPLYAEQKSAFYDSIDCFIFPSMYKNEAEPLVLYEAALSGGYLVGSRRGCMQEVISRFSGLSIEESGEMSNLISAAIKGEVVTGGFSHKARSERLGCFQQERKKALEALLGCIKDMEYDDLSKTK
jgi:glycosyltransferase involved in cell wall biosynthesis